MHQYTATTEGDVSLSAATAKTLVQVSTPASRRAALKEVAVGFNSTTTSHAPVLVQLRLQTTAGTGTARTPIAEDAADPAALCSSAVNFTVEPTGGSILREWRITPIGGQLIYQFPLGDEIRLDPSQRIGLVATAADAQSGVRASIKWQE